MIAEAPLWHLDSSQRRPLPFSRAPAPVMTRLREAMAQAVKAPEVVKTFGTAGSPVA